MCNVSGAIPTPWRTSPATTSAVKGRPALGISALPGWRANTVWYSLIGHSTGT